MLLYNQFTLKPLYRTYAVLSVVRHALHKLIREALLVSAVHQRTYLVVLDPNPENVFMIVPYNRREFVKCLFFSLGRWGYL